MLDRLTILFKQFGSTGCPDVDGDQSGRTLFKRRLY